MSLILDAGAFVSIERGDRLVLALLKAELLARRAPLTHGGVIGQIWRGGTGRQARVAKLLQATEIVPLDDALGRRTGILLGRSRKADVVDAAVVLIASDGDTILSSDVRDLAPLAEAAGVHVDLVAI